MDTALFEEQFGRLGGTIFELQDVQAHLKGELIVPMRELNGIRRKAVELLEHARQKPPIYHKRHAGLMTMLSPALSLSSLRKRS